MTQALKTDLYQLTMAAAYFHRGMTDMRVTCEAFLRRLPPQRAFLVMAGVPRLAAYLRELRFDDSDLAFLGQLPALRAAMTPPFVDYLRRFRFTGEVWAIPEGEVVFAGAPLVRITGPIIEAQIVETYLPSNMRNSGQRSAGSGCSAVGRSFSVVRSGLTAEECAILECGPGNAVQA